MKTKLLIVLLMLITGASWGQVSIDQKNKTITIDASSKVKKYETLIEESGDYELIISNPDNNSISIMKDAVMQPAFSLDTAIIKSTNEENIKPPNTIKFRKNTEYTFTIYANDEPKERTYIIKTKSNWSWTTTFGANAIIYTNRNKFTTQKTSDNSYEIVQVQDKKQIDLLPTIMFTFMNKQDDVSPGFSGGLGINFQEISVFLGPSLGVGQNILITGGIALSRQYRPSTTYQTGQIVSEAISTENLNELQYRFNPFVGISFRFDKNPFGKKSE